MHPDSDAAPTGLRAGFARGAARAVCDMKKSKPKPKRVTVDQALSVFFPAYNKVLGDVDMRTWSAYRRINPKSRHVQAARAGMRAALTLVQK